MPRLPAWGPPAPRAWRGLRPERRGGGGAWAPSRPRRQPAAPPRDPAQTLTRPLSDSCRESEAPRAREARPEDKPEKARAPRGQPMLPRPGPAPLDAVPQNRSEALGAAQAMQERARLLRRISAEHLRHLARPFWAAGWRPADVLHAIDHEPGGRPHGHTAEGRSPPPAVRPRPAARPRPGRP